LANRGANGKAGATGAGPAKIDIGTLFALV
jgi:hypothetical protein